MQWGSASVRASELYVIAVETCGRAQVAKQCARAARQEAERIRHERSRARATREEADRLRRESSQRAPLRARGREGPRVPGRVLIVDDDRSLRDALAEALRVDGFDVASTSSGRDALEWLLVPARRPCVVLLDLTMPEMTGYALLEMLVDLRLAQELAIVALTAEPRPRKVIGARRVIGKPFALDDLLTIVGDLCVRAAEKRESIAPTAERLHGD